MIDTSFLPKEIIVKDFVFLNPDKLIITGIK